MQRTAGKLEMHELGRLRAAALKATVIHPGPIGELVARELRAFADFGYRFSSDTLISALVAEIMRPPGTPGPDDTFTRLRAS